MLVLGEKNIQPTPQVPIICLCGSGKIWFIYLKKKAKGHLAGSDSSARDSGSWGCRFKPPTGCRD